MTEFASAGLTIQKGDGDAFEFVMQAPPVVRTELVATKQWFDGVDPRTRQQTAEGIVGGYQSIIQQIINGQRQNWRLSNVQLWRKRFSLPGCDVEYTNRDGFETIILTVYPENIKPSKGTRRITIRVPTTLTLKVPPDSDGNARRALQLKSPFFDGHSIASGLMVSGAKLLPGGRYYWEYHVRSTGQQVDDITRVITTDAGGMQISDVTSLGRDIPKGIANNYTDGPTRYLGYHTNDYGTQDSNTVGAEIQRKEIDLCGLSFGVSNHIERDFIDSAPDNSSGAYEQDDDGTIVLTPGDVVPNAYGTNPYTDAARDLIVLTRSGLFDVQRSANNGHSLPPLTAIPPASRSDNGKWGDFTFFDGDDPTVDDSPNVVVDLLGYPVGSLGRVIPTGKSSTFRNTYVQVGNRLIDGGQHSDLAADPSGGFNGFLARGELDAVRSGDTVRIAFDYSNERPKVWVAINGQWFNGSQPGDDPLVRLDPKTDVGDYTPSVAFYRNPNYQDETFFQAVDVDLVLDAGGMKFPIPGGFEVPAVVQPVDVDLNE